MHPGLRPHAFVRGREGVAVQASKKTAIACGREAISVQAETLVHIPLDGLIYGHLAVEGFFAMYMF